MVEYYETFVFVYRYDLLLIFIIKKKEMSSSSSTLIKNFD